MTLRTATFDAKIMARDAAERAIDVRAVPWDTVSETPDGREQFARGAFDISEPERVTLEAIGPHGAEPGVRLVGRAKALEDREDGLYATFSVSRTRDGDELLELARDGVYRGASVVFTPIKDRAGAGGVTIRERAGLARVGIVERAAYAGAEVLAVRSEDAQPMTDEQAATAADPAISTARVDVVTREDMEEVRNDMVSRMAILEGARGGAGTPHVLARWAGLQAYADAAYDDSAAQPLLARALADQLTTDSPGVVPPSWVPEVAGILARPRPAINALGVAPLGPSGMELDWPYLDPALNLDTIVAKQVTEKTQIASVKVKILKGSQPIDTYAGGSDVSYQLIRRSSPPYREAYLRILAIAYARATEAAFEAQLLAVAGSSLVLTATATADQVRAFLFAASSIVEDATGSPATVDLVSPTEFGRLGGLAGLYPAAYGTSNIPGTAQASTLAINVSGLPIIRAPFLTGNTHLVTNGEAASWHEDGPFPISAEDVSKLGQNVAIWGMGTGATTAPKGIVKSTLT
jgi:HK97 family phage prohead protease